LHKNSTKVSTTDKQSHCIGDEKLCKETTISANKLEILITYSPKDHSQHNQLLID